MVSKNWKLFVAHLSGFWLHKILLDCLKKKIFPAEKNGGNEWARPPTSTVTVSLNKSSTASPIFAADFGNGNIMSETLPITELNTSTLVCALTVLKTFCSQINLHQATMTVITVMPGSVTAYTISPWINTQVCRPRKDERNSLAGGAPCSNSNTDSTLKQYNRGKRDPATPDTNEDNSSGCQKQKKHCCGAKVNTAVKEKKGLGMFYLRNASVNPSDIFPKDMHEKVCPNFTPITCKGKECNNVNCDFAHPRKVS
jgi:hypothetical protein